MEVERPGGRDGILEVNVVVFDGIVLVLWTAR